jgi:hypothetical protein
MRVQGHAVLGGYQTLARLVDEEAVDCVVISTSHIDPARLRDLLGVCAARGVQVVRLRVGLEALNDVAPLAGS